MELAPSLVPSALEREYPAYQAGITHGAYGDRRYVVTARDMATRPYCLVSRDVSEIRAALGEAGA